MMKRGVVRVLVRLYPVAWREEYGQELADLMMARPLSPWALVDVLWSAAREQVRGGEPWVLVGLALMLLSLPGYAFRAVALPASSLVSWGIIACLTGAATWTGIRCGGGGGRAAMKATLLWRAPGFVFALLAALGALPVKMHGIRTFPNPGLAIAFHEPTALSPWFFIRLLILVPITELPVIGLLGYAGGLVGRAGLRYRERRTVC
jgi:hypothetical protein